MITPRVVFVCRGNICRSPLALALYGRLSDGRAISRALEFCNIGRAADQTVAAAAAANGLRLDAHRSTPLSDADERWAELLVTMEAQHNAVLLERFGPAVTPKLVLLHPDGLDIPDPY